VWYGTYEMVKWRIPAKMVATSVSFAV